MINIPKLLYEAVAKEFKDYGGPWLYYLLALYISLPLLAYYIIPTLTANPMKFTKRKSISIIVLGDLGHSPRMRYHALSLSKYEYVVNLVGYIESDIPIEIIDDPNIELYDIKMIKNQFNLPFVVFAAYKVMFQVVSIFQLLFQLKGSNYIMIQNPPSLPLLLMVVVFTKLFSRRTKLVIDWHNLNYTILNLKYNNLNHPMVKFLKWYEKSLSGYADLNLTVTEQMKSFLVNEFNVESEKIITLYDRPNERFQPQKFGNDDIQQQFPNIDMLMSGIPDNESYKIIISSTSFTPDEDFNILLDALVLYQKDMQSDRLLPPILCVITGKGPMKDQFLSTVRQLDFDPKQIIVKNVWLDPEEYPIMISMAKLGISLHTSSSGIDLPMKIVDMFGCGVPVISLQFPAIGELVKDGVNGLITTKNNQKQDQSTQVYQLLKQALMDNNLYQTIKNGAMEETKLRWDQNWTKCLASTFK
ncbi:mannosyltransferase [Scheffersomyces spartinae]|uniref:Chitobiosyldiphosphodolichol beta-mannosyltransferase n=1 Tax=Scheffersomyces spartinae TaxID=45513 RepID=A0A9P7V9H8_9ASCO|nr:mannosyltransferase [Scheffersomyces spartinae]KAG7193520.1 mannosyltransferase [Scheffersomyces spartinae]